MNDAALATADQTVAGVSRVYTRLTLARGDLETAHGILTAESAIPRGDKRRVYPIWGLRIEGRPLAVRVYKEDECWLAEHQPLNVCATGASPKEAIDVAEEHMRYFMEYYASTAVEDLTGYALELKERFEKVSAVEGSTGNAAIQS